MGDEGGFISKLNENVKKERGRENEIFSIELKPLSLNELDWVLCFPSSVQAAADSVPSCPPGWLSTLCSQCTQSFM